VKTVWNEFGSSFSFGFAFDERLMRRYERRWIQQRVRGCDDRFDGDEDV